MKKPRSEEESLYLKKLGENISKIGIEKGIAPKVVYETLEIDRSNYRRIIAGRTNPSILLLRKIAKALEVEMKELVSF